VNGTLLGWHKLEGEPEESCVAGDDALCERTVYYQGPPGYLEYCGEDTVVIPCADVTYFSRIWHEDTEDAFYGISMITHTYFRHAGEDGEALDEEYEGYEHEHVDYVEITASEENARQRIDEKCVKLATEEDWSFAWLWGPRYNTNGMV
jgi:hypothetical protein